MTIAIILSLKSIAYSQVTETKEVKVSVLKAIGKDLEKCKLTQKAFDLKSANFDSLVNININLFKDLEIQQQERLELQNKLNDLNKEYTKAVKNQKQGWLIPALIGVSSGIIIGVVL